MKYDVIIRRIYEETLDSLKSSCPATNIDKEDVNVLANTVILAVKSGIYEGFDGGSLLKLCDRKDCVISILHPPGTFLMKGIPAANVRCNLSEAEREEFEGVLYIHQSESIEGNVFYEFRQLTEAGIKALSPGINDPGTAIQVTRSLFALYPTGVVIPQSNISETRTMLFALCKED